MAQSCEGRGILWDYIFFFQAEDGIRNRVRSRGLGDVYKRQAQVRRSLREPHLPRGRFAPLEETGPHWFHRQIYRALFEST